MGGEGVSIGQEKAIQLGHSGWWRGKPARYVAMRQLDTREVIMPWDEFRKALDSALGRNVAEVEFTNPDLLKQEITGERDAPSEQDTSAAWHKAIGPNKSIEVLPTVDLSQDEEGEEWKHESTTMSKARQILNSITEADEPATTKYHTFIRSANNFSEFSSSRKRTVDTGLTYDEAKRACAAYNAELSPSQKRRGTKMEFSS